MNKPISTPFLMTHPRTGTNLVRQNINHIINKYYDIKYYDCFSGHYYNINKNIKFIEKKIEKFNHKDIIDNFDKNINSVTIIRNVLETMTSLYNTRNLWDIGDISFHDFLTTNYQDMPRYEGAKIAKFKDYKLQIKTTIFNRKDLNPLDYYLQYCEQKIEESNCIILYSHFKKISSRKKILKHMFNRIGNTYLGESLSKEDLLTDNQFSIFVDGEKVSPNRFDVLACNKYNRHLNNIILKERQKICK